MNGLTENSQTVNKLTGESEGETFEISLPIARVVPDAVEDIEPRRIFRLADWLSVTFSAEYDCPNYSERCKKEEYPMNVRPHTLTRFLGRPVLSSSDLDVRVPSSRSGLGCLSTWDELSLESSPTIVKFLPVPSPYCP